MMSYDKLTRIVHKMIMDGQGNTVACDEVVHKLVVGTPKRNYVKEAIERIQEREMRKQKQPTGDDEDEEDD